MATNNDTGFATFTATAVAIAAYSRVKIDSAGLILISGAAADSIGVTVEDILASGTGVVKLWSAPGTFFCLVGSGGTTAGTATTAQSTSGTVGTAGIAILLMPLETVASGAVAECARIV